MRRLIVSFILLLALSGVAFGSGIVGVGGGGGVPTYGSQDAHKALIGPASGGATTPTFRVLEDGDIPDDITCSNYLALATATAKGVFIASAAGTPSFVAATGANKLFGIDGSGNLGFYENISLVLNTNPSTDSTYSGTLATFTCGQSGGCAVGKIVYGKLNGTAHNVYYYDSDATDKTEPPIGVVVVAGTEGGTATILTNGILRLDSLAFTASTDEGKKIYASTSAGGITVTEPATNGVIVGYVIEPPGIAYFNFANMQACTGSGAPVRAVTPTFTTSINLPSSDADPGTTAGNFKHDSSNPNSSGGGILEYFDGTGVRQLIDTGTNYTIITKTEFLPVAWMEDGATAPSAAALTASTHKVRTRAFSGSANNDLEVLWQVPDDYVGGIKFRFIGYVTNATAPANTEVVAFSLAGLSLGNSDGLGGAAGSAQTSSLTADASYAQYDRVAGAYSSEITVTDITAGESAHFTLTRLATTTDTYAQAFGLAGIEIKYKAKIKVAGDY